MTTRNPKSGRQTKESANKTLIYIGPSTKQLQRFTVFNNGLSDFANKHKEKCPALGALFVPVENLNDVQQKLKDSASAESIFYEKVKEYLEGVK